VVERVGVLAELYEAAAVSFVGGGFHGRGLHSVLEPAAAGSPILFGPQHQNARAAEDLIKEGGAKVAEDPQALAGVINTWLVDGEAGRTAGVAASRYIDRHRGAAARSAALLDSLLSTNR
jgi:3-deoxy-D-manno-octulosonic-acid transferase